MKTRAWILTLLSAVALVAFAAPLADAKKGNKHAKKAASTSR